MTRPKELTLRPRIYLGKEKTLDGKCILQDIFLTRKTKTGGEDIRIGDICFQGLKGHGPDREWIISSGSFLDTLVEPIKKGNKNRAYLARKLVENEIKRLRNELERLEDKIVLLSGRRKEPGLVHFYFLEDDWPLKIKFSRRRKVPQGVQSPQPSTQAQSSTPTLKGNENDRQLNKQPQKDGQGKLWPLARTTHYF